MARLAYQNGTWFNIPLRSGGFARGVVARHDGKGQAFGYFFGPWLEVQEVKVPSDLGPDDRILWGMFGDLRLSSIWSIIGTDESWNESEWPMPAFVRIDEHTGIAFLTTYDEVTFRCDSETRCDPKFVKNHPYDRLMGAGAVEIRLTNLLK